MSEARKAGKPGHSVTFGKGSICVYDQDEPVDSEVAVQDESSNDTVDQEPCGDEIQEVDDDSQENKNQDPSTSTHSDISTFRLAFSKKLNFVCNFCLYFLLLNCHF